MLITESTIFTIYALVDPSNNQVFYIGLTTKDAEERFKAHLYSCFGKGSKENVHKYIIKNKINPTLIIIEKTKDSNREKFWIEYYIHSLKIKLTNSKFVPRYYQLKGY